MGEKGLGMWYREAPSWKDWVNTKETQMTNELVSDIYVSFDAIDVMKYRCCLETLDHAGKPAARSCC